MITVRTLNKWRKEALVATNKFDPHIYEEDRICHSIALAYRETSQRILRMTQELLDQHLLRK